MNNPTFMSPEDFKAYLAKHGIAETKTSRDGKEVSFPCPFNGCDDDHRTNEEYHCSFNCDTCVYNCFKCAEKGNFITLMQYFDDYDEWRSEQKKNQKPVSAKKQPSLEAQVKKYHEATREQVREYFNGRGINNKSIDSFMLGAGIFGGQRGLMIPVFDREDKIAYVKLRRAPEDEASETIADSMGKKNPVSKYRVYPTDSQLLLVGEAELTKSTSSDVLICEGELDRILAMQEGVKIPIVTGGGANIFKDEWIDALKNMRNIYICFDKDKAGEDGCSKLSQRLAERIPNASIFKISLPFEEGSHADLTDYFTTKKGTADELFSKYSKHIAGTKPIDASKFKELTIDDIAKTLNTTIKHDNVNKVITFLAMLLTYTDSDQINVMFNASSSTGKSYICLETSKYFPEQDVSIYGKTSPTAFFYSQKLRKKDNQTGEPYVDLARRIMIFTELPDTQLQENLRSILSHDRKKVPFANTNKSGKGGKNVADEGYLLGFPSAFFCSANTNIDEQEQTRCLILSPDSTREKVMAGIDTYIDRSCHKDAFDAKLRNDSERKALMERILYVKSLNVKTVDINDSDYLRELFLGKLKGNVPPRAMREIHKVTALAKAMALINAPFRSSTDGVITGTKKDIDSAIELWGAICESLVNGLPPQVFDFYKKVILPTWLKKNTNTIEPKGITYQEIRLAYNNIMGSWPSQDTMRKRWMPTLQDVNFVSIYRVTKDKGGDGRSLYITPLVFFNDDLEKDK